MAKIPTVTCARCGQSFSALRADCPYCGQRRTIGADRPTRSEPARRPASRPASRPRDPQQAPGPRWQLVAGLLLIAAGVLAVLLMVLSTRTDIKGISLRPTPTPSPAQTARPRPTPTPTPSPKCENVRIFYLNHEITAEAGGFTMYPGDPPLTLTARAYPIDKLSDARFSWSVSDSSKARLTPSADTQSCEIEALESAGGSIKLYVTCYGYTLEMPFYIWSR